MLGPNRDICSFVGIKFTGGRRICLLLFLSVIGNRLLYRTVGFFWGGGGMLFIIAPPYRF